jgi:tRNA threonylcarbamoyl adenosine modification protein YjeE
MSSSPETAAVLAKELQPGDLLLFRGELGAGKTTFVGWLVAALKSEARVKSPTFSLVREYPTARGKFLHLDLYRLKKEEELTEIGWPDLREEAFATAIEWPEKIPAAEITGAWQLYFSRSKEGQRVVEIFTPRGESFQPLPGRLPAQPAF